MLGSSLHLKGHNSYPIKYIYSESIGRNKGFSMNTRSNFRNNSNNQNIFEICAIIYNKYRK